MYISVVSMYIDAILAPRGNDLITTATKRTHKHFQLDSRPPTACYVEFQRLGRSPTISFWRSYFCDLPVIGAHCDDWLASRSSYHTSIIRGRQTAGSLD